MWYLGLVLMLRMIAWRAPLRPTPKPGRRRFWSSLQPSPKLGHLILQSVDLLLHDTIM
jgi:hypothetical protein